MRHGRWCAMMDLNYWVYFQSSFDAIKIVLMRSLQGSNHCWFHFRIVCAVGPGSGANAIQLRLGQSGRRFVDSSSMFQFVDPQPKSVFPTFGPLSGGTRLAIYGANLNVGSNTTILIGTYPCKLLHEVKILGVFVVSLSQQNCISIIAAEEHFPAFCCLWAFITWWRYEV